MNNFAYIVVIACAVMVAAIATPHTELALLVGVILGCVSWCAVWRRNRRNRKGEK